MEAKQRGSSHWAEIARQAISPHSGHSISRQLDGHTARCFSSQRVQITHEACQ
jgi:hypothetical protein